MTEHRDKTTSSTELRKDTIGLLGAATLGMAFLSPAMTIYAVFGPLFLACGRAVPFSLMTALLATLPTALSYAILSRDHPSSGSTADWATQAAGHGAGAWVGWIVFLYYLTNNIVQVATGGLFFNELLLALGIRLPAAVGFTAGALLISAWPAWMVYRGVALSVKGALSSLLVEIATVSALCATVLWLAPARGIRINFEGFNPAFALKNSTGFFGAMVFAMLSFTGFDVVSTLAEETRTARKLIPRATFLALILYSVFLIAGMWVLTFSRDATQLTAAIAAGRTPINDVAASVWGRWSILVTITALTAAMGLLIAGSVGASRVLYAKARRGAAPAAFATLHPKFKVPWVALHFIMAVGIVASLILYIFAGAYGTYVWWATTTTFFAMLTYLFTNIAAIVLNRHRLVSMKGLLTYALLPACGILFDLYILVQSFFISLWQQSWMMGKSVVIFDVVCSALVLFVVLRKLRTQAAVE